MERKIAAAITACLLFVSIPGGCQKIAGPQDGQAAFQGEFLISAAETKEKIADQDVQIIDARGVDGAAGGTVEGAAVTDWQSLSTCSEGQAGDEQWGLVPAAKDLEKRLQNLGIEKDKEIIVIGEAGAGWGEEARILWELRQAGCGNIKIVDGGITALKKAGVLFKKETGQNDSSDITVETLDKSHEITTGQLQADYTKYIIIDTRTKAEYEGAVLHGEAKGGRLPGAISIPYSQLFRKDETLKSKEELIKLFEDNGLSKEDHIVTYCTGGIRSAYTQLVLEMCGYQNTYNYGQSYWRWAVVGQVE